MSAERELIVWLKPTIAPDAAKQFKSMGELAKKSQDAIVNGHAAATNRMSATEKAAARSREIARKQEARQEAADVESSIRAHEKREKFLQESYKRRAAEAARSQREEERATQKRTVLAQKQVREAERAHKQEERLKVQAERRQEIAAHRIERAEERVGMARVRAWGASMHAAERFMQIARGGALLGLSGASKETQEKALQWLEAIQGGFDVAQGAFGTWRTLAHAKHAWGRYRKVSAAASGVSTVGAGEKLLTTAEGAASLAPLTPIITKAATAGAAAAGSSAAAAAAAVVAAVVGAIFGGNAIYRTAKEAFSGRGLGRGYSGNDWFARSSDYNGGLLVSAYDWLNEKTGGYANGLMRYTSAIGASVGKESADRIAGKKKLAKAEKQLEADRERHERSEAVQAIDLQQQASVEDAARAKRDAILNYQLAHAQYAVAGTVNPEKYRGGIFGIDSDAAGMATAEEAASAGAAQRGTARQAVKDQEARMAAARAHQEEVEGKATSTTNEKLAVLEEATKVQSEYIEVVLKSATAVQTAGEAEINMERRKLASIQETLNARRSGEASFAHLKPEEQAQVRSALLLAHRRGFAALPKPTQEKALQFAPPELKEKWENEFIKQQTAGKRALGGGLVGTDWGQTPEEVWGQISEKDLKKQGIKKPGGANIFNIRDLQQTIDKDSAQLSRDMAAELERYSQKIMQATLRGVQDAVRKAAIQLDQQRIRIAVGDKVQQQGVANPQ